MRRFVIAFLLIGLLTGCDRGSRAASPAVKVDTAMTYIPQEQQPPHTVGYARFERADVSLRGFQTVAAPTEEASAGTESPKPIAGFRQQRLITRSAQVRAVVTDPSDAAKALRAWVEANGGYVSESREWRSGTQMVAGLKVRIPAAVLLKAIEAIRRQALRVESEDLSGQDMTEEYVDLNAQIENLKATETELRALLTTVRQRTQKAADILEVFNRLTAVRGEIDQAQTRINTLDKLAALATISVDLVPDVLSRPLTAEAWRPVKAVRSAFGTLLSTLRWLFDAGVWLLVYILPVVVVVAVPSGGLALGGRAAWRRIGPRLRLSVPES